MKRRFACGAAAGTLFLFAAVSARPLTNKSPRCKAGQNDILCVKHSLVKLLKPTLTLNVKPGTARRLPPKGALIRLTRRGLADVYLGRAAQCLDLSLTRRGTSFWTRVPRRALLTQLRGDAYCTMADKRVIWVGAGTTLPALTVQLPRKARKFYAVVKANDPQGEPSEYRIKFYPRTKLVIATHKGSISVQLPTGAPSTVPVGKELVVSLPNGTLGAVKIIPATFSPADASRFGQQLQLPDLAVTIQGATVSCPTPSSCTTTVNYTLGNLGRVKSPRVSVVVRADPGDQKTVLEPEIPVGKPVRRSTTVGPDRSCFNPDCNVRVVVDPNNAILELNEQNNAASDLIPG